MKNSHRHHFHHQLRKLPAQTCFKSTYITIWDALSSTLASSGLMADRRAGFPSSVPVRCLLLVVLVANWFDEVNCGQESRLFRWLRDSLFRWQKLSLFRCSSKASLFWFVLVGDWGRCETLLPYLGYNLVTTQLLSTTPQHTHGPDYMQNHKKQLQQTQNKSK